MAHSGWRLFLSQFWNQYHTTGAIWPSGSSLANELAYYVGNSETQPQAARRILEVGPGTGTVTTAILKRLRPTDHLTLVEINPDFAAHLRQRFESEPSWQRVATQVQIQTTAIQDVNFDEPFDLIVSGLPLNNFSVEVVATILAGFEQLVKVNGTISFFEYIAIRHFKGLVSSRAERQRLQGIADLLTKFLEQREIRRRAISWNLPPAWAHHVQKTA